MGWRFRKQFGSGGFRGSLTKRGIGMSWGIPGVRFGVSPTGRRFLSLSIPGTGLYWIKYFGGEKTPNSGPANLPTGPPTPHLPQPPGQLGQTSSTGTPWWKQPP